MRKIEVYFDGSCEPINPRGTGRIGVVIKENGRSIYKGHREIGSGDGMTSNVAEYEALIDGLNYLIKNNLKENKIEVKGDSKLVIYQMLGYWKIHKGFYKKSALACRELVESFNDIMIKWIPRELNYEADYLSKIGV